MIVSIYTALGQQNKGLVLISNIIYHVTEEQQSADDIRNQPSRHLESDLSRNAPTLKHPYATQLRRRTNRRHVTPRHAAVCATSC